MCTAAWPTMAMSILIPILTSYAYKRERESVSNNYSGEGDEINRAVTRPTSAKC